MRKAIPATLFFLLKENKGGCKSMMEDTDNATSVKKSVKRKKESKSFDASRNKQRNRRTKK